MSRRLGKLIPGSFICQMCVDVYVEEARKTEETNILLEPAAGRQLGSN